MQIYTFWLFVFGSAWLCLFDERFHEDLNRLLRSSKPLRNQKLMRDFTLCREYKIRHSFMT